MGMGLIDSNLLKRFHRLTMRSRAFQPKAHATTGESFALRDYSPGDDYRAIDWRLCARRDDLLTKVVPHYRQRHSYVLLDCSPSMGIDGGVKRQLALRAAALLGYASLVDQECFHAAAFADGVAAETGPLHGKTCLGRLWRFLDDLPLRAAQTSLMRTALSFTRRYQPHGPVTIISDLHDPNGFSQALDVLCGRGYRPRVLHVYAPCEADPGLLGDVELLDIEDATVREATITPRTADRYRRRFAEFCASVRDYCRRRVIPLVQVASDAPEDDVLVQVLQ